MSHKTPSVRLVLDWDGTMTMNDTTGLIGEAAIRLNPRDRDSSATMAKCVDRYMEDYNAWKAGNPSSDTLPRDLDTELRHLDSMSTIEARSFLRVRHAAMRGHAESTGNEHGSDNATEAEQGWQRHMWTAGAEAVRSGKLRIRDPVHLKMLLRWIEDGSPDRSWAIVSVSWSREFVLGAIIEAGLVPNTEAEQARISSRIRCNELLAPLKLDDSGKPRLIQTAGDKLRALKEAVLADLGEEGLAKGNTSSRKGDDGSVRYEDREFELERQLQKTVYIGDSTTDLGCLAAAKLGVFMLNENADPGKDKLRKMLEILQIDCPRLSEISSFAASRGNEDATTGEAKRPNICCTTSFEELFPLLQNN